MSSNFKQSVNLEITNLASGSQENHNSYKFLTQPQKYCHTPVSNLSQHEIKSSILAEVMPEVGLNMNIESLEHQFYAYLKSCLCKYEYAFNI